MRFIMNIGFNALTLLPGEYSGVHVATRGLLNSLLPQLSAEDRLTLYTQRRTPANLPLDDPRVQQIKPSWPVHWRAGRITWEQFRLFRRVFEDGIDLLHCPAYVMPRMCMKPVVVNVHDVFALRMPLLCTRANRGHFRRLLPISLDRASRVIVPTNYVKDEILQWNTSRKDDILNLAEKTRVIPWGVDARFQPITDPQKREDLALKYGLPPKFILFVGRVEPKKNIPTLIQAYFAAVMTAQLPHRLVMVGPKGWGTDGKVRTTIHEHEITDRVCTPGFIPDIEMPTLYSMAEALIFPSYFEGFGLPVLEAMACGTPVIASETPALKEVAGEAALFIHPQNLPQLREAIENVLTNEPLRQKLIAAGKKRVAKFTWQAHAAATLEIYREVIAEDQARYATPGATPPTDTK